MALAAAGVLTVTDLLERKSVEEITGKATQDVTTFDSIIATIIGPKIPNNNPKIKCK